MTRGILSNETCVGVLAAIRMDLGQQAGQFGTWFHIDHEGGSFLRVTKSCNLVQDIIYHYVRKM